MEILLLYYIFSVLFMIGYINTNDIKGWMIIVHCLFILVISPIAFPINIGYYFNKNS